MAVSLGVFSSFLVEKNASMTKSSSSCSVRLGVPSSRVNMHAVRTVTSATVLKPATKTRKKEPRGIMKPKRVSSKMQAFLWGVLEIPRTEAFKQIWAYIKQHNLQDPENKKIIVCDKKLKKIFGGRDQVGFLEIVGLMNPHFLK